MSLGQNSRCQFDFALSTYLIEGVVMSANILCHIVIIPVI